MSVQKIDVDAKPERRRKAVLSAPAKVQSGIVNVASAEPSTSVWNGSGNPCPAGQQLGIRAQRVAFPERKRGADQIAEYIGAMSTVGDV